jgi:hypothetical protein
MADIYIEYLPPTDNKTFDLKAQALIDLLRTHISEHDTSLTTLEAAVYVNYVDRGDPAAFDFAVGDLTTDGAWHDLDLSSIVPASAKAVIIKVAIEDNAAGNAFAFRKNGNSNAFNIARQATQVADVTIHMPPTIIPVDTNRVIEYLATSTTWTTINIQVCGWFI